MSNEYYQNSTNVVPGNKVKAEDLNTRMDQVEDGFDKLPSPITEAPTSKGFDEVFTVLDATAENHPASAKQVRDGALTYAEDTGSANAIVASLSQAPSAYVTGMGVNILVANTNTAATTINLNGLGAKSVKRITGDDVSGGDIVAGRVIGLRYNGTFFTLLDGMYAVHNHNDLYYSEDEVDSFLAGKSDASHTHDDRYYTEAEMDSLLGDKSDTTHLHDDRYYTESETDAAIMAALPVGTILPFAGETPPSTYFECHGGEVSRTTYSSLYAVTGDLWGAGDGSTTFNLPQLQGEHLRGWDHGAGRDPNADSRTGGDHVGSTQEDAYKTHSHTTDIFFMKWPTSGSKLSETGGIAGYTYASGTNSSGGSETRGKNKAVMFIIKAY